MVEAIHQLVRSFDPEFQERLRNRVLLAGGGSQIQGLPRALEEAMSERLGGGRVIRTPGQRLWRSVSTPVALERSQ